MSDTKEFLSANEILSLGSQLKIEEVHVPELKPGAFVRVRAMTGFDRDAFEISLTRKDGNGKREEDLSNLRAKFLANVLVDENGAKLFSPEQVSALGRVSAAALDRMYAVASRLNGLTDKDLKELAGNSEDAPGGDS